MRTHVREIAPRLGGTRPAAQLRSMAKDKPVHDPNLPWAIHPPLPVAKSSGGGSEPKWQDGELHMLTIFSPDPPNPQISAQYNPKEIQIDRSVPWAKHATTGAPKKNGEAAKERGMLSLEFTGSESRAVTVELLFDGFETGTSVGPQLDVLEKLATVRDPDRKEEEYRRPYRCVVVWGETLRNFRCVIESLSIKYTMMSATGQPLRATATVKLKEADIVHTK